MMNYLIKRNNSLTVGSLYRLKQNKCCISTGKIIYSNSLLAYLFSYDDKVVGVEIFNASKVLTNLSLTKIRCFESGNQVRGGSMPWLGNRY